MIGGVPWETGGRFLLPTCYALDLDLRFIIM